MILLKNVYYQYFFTIEKLKKLYFKNNCLDDLTITSPTFHKWCYNDDLKSATGRKCPGTAVDKDPITGKVLNEENPRCLTGVYVECELGDVCTVQGIANKFVVSEEQVEVAGLNGFRITGETTATITIVTLNNVTRVPTPAPAPASEEESSSIGPIIGGVVGGLLLCGFAIYFFIFRKPSGYQKVDTV